MPTDRRKAIVLTYIAIAVTANLVVNIGPPLWRWLS